MFNCYQVSFKGRVIGLFPNNGSALAFVRRTADDCFDTGGEDYDDYGIVGRFIPGLPF